MISQALPSEATTAGEIARQLAQILGPAYQPADGTVIAAELLAYGDAIAIVLANTLQSINEAFANLSIHLLGEYEVEYGLPVRPDLSNAVRQARIVAKIQAIRRASPNGITTAVRSVVGSLGSVIIYENATSNADFASYPRGVFQFGVTIGTSAWNNYDVRVQAQQIVNQMKPAHTRGDVGASKGFILGTSLLGRDLL